jgi:hypothetical protein
VVDDRIGVGVAVAVAIRVGIRVAVSVSVCVCIALSTTVGTGPASAVVAVEGPVAIVVGTVGSRERLIALVVGLAADGRHQADRQQRDDAPLPPNCHARPPLESVVEPAPERKDFRR